MSPLGFPESTSDISTSRRDLLTRAAALAGVAAITACKSSGDPRPIPRAAAAVPLGPDEPARIAVIGTGGMGGGHIDGIIDSDLSGAERVKIVALADVCKPRLDGALRHASEKQGFQVDGYRDHRQLLARDDIHGVLIATPEHWHVPMSVDAIAAGKDVYVEKPLCMRYEDALYLSTVVDANDRILQSGTQFMMMPKYREARRLIAAGAIGHPTLSQTSYCRNSREGEWLYSIDPAVQPGEMLDWSEWCGPAGQHEWNTEVYHRWRRYKSWSTGIIGDLLVHQMTPLMYALDVGWPVRVSASGGHYVFPDMENPDQVLLTIEFERGHTMVVAGSVCNDSGLETLIRGHEADLLLGGDRVVLRPQGPFAEELEPQEIVCLGDTDWQAQLRGDWFRSMRTRAPNQSRIDVAAQCMVAVDLSARSIWDGCAYEFDPATLTHRTV